MRAHFSIIYVAEQVIKRVLPAAIGTLVRWDIVQARAVAADILEDVNDRQGAAAIRRWK